MLRPASTIISICGGVTATARLTGRSVSRVCRWRWPSDRGGTGGLVPKDVQQALLTNARANGIALAPTDFFADPYPPLATSATGPDPACPDPACPDTAPNGGAGQGNEVSP